MIWPFSRKRPAPSPPPAPRAPQPAVPLSPPRYPAGYVADPARADVFDPALKHYPSAFVKGPPIDGTEAAALSAARSALLQRSLAALAPSSVRDQAVLRGSLALEAWYPGRARQARDLDLVVRDASCDPDGREGTALLADIGRVVTAALAAADVPVLAATIPVDKIWTYERAEGRQLSVPWQFRDTVDTLTIDLVFREVLQDAPRIEQVRRVAGAHSDGDEALSFWLASRAESLAWKLLWLETDMHPQGKDLYDASLLAEDTALPLDLVERVYVAKKDRWTHGRSAGFVRALEVDWETFALAYPELAGDDPAAHATRLEASLRFV